MMRSVFRKSLLVLGLLVAGAAEYFLLPTSIGERIEINSADFWFQKRGEIDAPADLAIIALDEASYKALGVPLNQAWPRRLHARMLRKLRELGVARVAMDILFLGSGLNPAEDEELADAMSEIPTVIGADIGEKVQWIGDQNFRIIELLEPAPVFTKAAQGIGLVRMPEDYGTFRRFAGKRTELSKEVPPLYEAAIGKTAWRETPGSRDMIRFYGPAGTIRTYSYHVLLDDESSLPADALKGKVVFIGLNLRTGLGPEQKDSFRTPFGDRSTFGVEIHATAAANLLERNWIHRLPASTERLALALSCMLVATGIFSMRPQWSGLLMLLVVALWAGAAYQGFLGGLFLPGVTAFFIVLPVIYMLSTLIYYLGSYYARQKVEKAFRLYLPPQMAKQMRQNPKALQLGGEYLTATAFFSDIAQFSRLAEEMNPVDVASMLNEYFTEVARVVFANQGTLIKFIGDSVFAVFGAPVKMENHAELACRAALGIQSTIEAFNQKKKFPELKTRIGIHTGGMVVGNLGSSERFDYTAIGDAVNLASRLEGANKYLGTSIILSDASASEINGALGTIKLAKVRVAGKMHNVEIFTIDDGKIDSTILTKWNNGLEAFLSQRMDVARKSLEEVKSSRCLLSTAADLYLNGIEGSPTADVHFTWAGEIVLARK